MPAVYQALYQKQSDLYTVFNFVHSTILRGGYSYCHSFTGEGAKDQEY